MEPTRSFSFALSILWFSSVFSCVHLWLIAARASHPPEFDQAAAQEVAQAAQRQQRPGRAALSPAETLPDVAGRVAEPLDRGVERQHQLVGEQRRPRTAALAQEARVADERVPV